MDCFLLIVRTNKPDIVPQMRTATAVTAVLLGMLACAQATQYSFQADFTHYESKFGAGKAYGKLYYRYDTSKKQNNVIHFNYTAPTTISVIYVEGDKRIYKRCGNDCEGSAVESMSLPLVVYNSNNIP